jgi:hypothetical protein
MAIAHAIFVKLPFFIASSSALTDSRFPDDGAQMENLSSRTG